MDAEGKQANAANAFERPSYRYFVLGMLLLLYILNYVDRQIIGILAIPIKDDLKLSDTEIGLMGGIAFAFLYSILGLPVARLADKHKRVTILSSALVLWSIATTLCGLAHNFWTLFLTRVGVGVGEAGGTAPSYSLLSDVFPPKQRGRALSVFFLGSQVGGALGILLGGHLAPEIGWRATFIVVGSIGLIVAPFFYFLVREPPRGQYDPPAKADNAQASLSDVITFVRNTPTLWFLIAGSALAAMFNYGYAFWMPMLLMRTLKMGLTEMSNFFALATLIGGSAGMLLAGTVADWLSTKRRDAYGLVASGTILLTVPFVCAAVLIPNFWVAAACIVVTFVISNNWGPTSTTAVQNIAPASMRTTISAIYLLVVNLFGLGLGTLVFGAASDWLTPQFGEGALGQAYLICALTIYPVAAVCLFIAGRLLTKATENS